MKKSSKAPNKKPKSAKSKKPSTHKLASTTKKTLEKLPVSTFDAWVSKQVRIEKKGGVIVENTTEILSLPKDTYETWIENQKPKESSQQKIGSPGPSTFDLWLTRQIAIRDTAEEKEETPSASEPQSAM